MTLPHQQQSKQVSSIRAAFVGRTEQLGVLARAFSSVVDNQESRVVSIAGSSGAGKSSLVEKFVASENVRGISMFCKAKCDKSRGNEPFSVLKDILEDIAVMMLQEKFESTNQLIDDARIAVGPGGSLLISLVPALSDVLDQTRQRRPSHIEDVNAAKDSLIYLFRAFFRAISNHLPLVIFCDDLQWVDVASWQILSWLATDCKMKRLMVIVAYRRDQTSSNPAVTRGLVEIEQKKLAGLARIQLYGLSQREVNHLLSILLRRDEAETMNLAQVVHDKTNGNVLFVLEYLEVLKQRKFLVRSLSDGEAHWNWTDVARLQQDTTIADNITDLIVSNLRSLSFGIQRSLQIASCLSSNVSAEILQKLIASLQVKSETAIEAQLNEACARGLLFKDSHHGNTSYHFVHDRLRNAAYSLVEGSRRDRLHYDIGMHLLGMRDETDQPELKQWISFIVTEQLQLGLSCIADEVGFTILAKLNLDAGKKAMELSAFVAASQYLRRGLQLMKNVDRPWENYHHLHFSLHRLLADISWCIGEPAASERLAKETIMHARKGLERAHGCLTLAQALGSQDRHKEAIAVEVKELIRLRVFPRSFRLVKGVALLMKMKKILKKKSVDDILQLPECNNERISVAHAFLQLLGTHATFHNDAVLQLMSAWIRVKLVLKYGINNMAISCFAQVGVFIGVLFGDVKEGYRLGQMFRGLMRRCSVKDTFGSMIYWAYLHPWTNALEESMDGLLEVYNSGMQQGHVEMAFASFAFYNSHALRASLSLAPMVEDMKSLLVTVQEYAADAVLIPLRVVTQFMLNLVGECDDPRKLTGSVMDEAEFLKSNNSQVALHSFHLAKLYTIYHYGYLEEADKERKAMVRYGKTSVSFVEVITKMYFEALVPLSLAGKTNSSRHKRRARIAINTLRKAVTKEDRDMNLSHLLQLLDAGYLSLDRSKANTLVVQRRFDSAIKMCTRGGFRQDAAVANLLAAQYFIRMEDDFNARYYLSEAIQLYKDWGAIGVANHFGQKYSHHLAGAKVEKLHSTNHRSRLHHSKTRYNLQSQSIRTFLTTEAP